jgi:hypothetical protein
MRALVVYESMFGNAKSIAEAIAAGLADAHCRVEVDEVSEAPRHVERTVDLLVVGGPTHTFGLPRPATRATAASEAEDGTVSQGTGVREWLDALDQPEGGTRVAAFATRTARPRFLTLIGSTSGAIERRLGQRGYARLAPHESFFVGGKQGPLVAGEAARARAWGRDLGERLHELRG